MNAIACVDLNWGLGRDGNLLYHIHEDMEFFKSKTKGKVIIYGNSTLKSFPGGKPLKDRINIVITTDRNNISKDAINNSTWRPIKLGRSGPPLSHLFFEAEITDALQSYANNRAPGPDVFNFLFYMMI